jgi:hypothetical protein
MSGRTELQDALRRAIAFLERRQLPGGELPVLASGKPDPAVYPTAVMVHSLSFAPDAAQVREKALDFLAAEMGPRGLWKHWTRAHPHAHQLPPDLDDTSCASAALTHAGRRIPDNRAVLLANRDRRGLFYTWKLTRAQFAHPLVTYLFFRRTSAKPFDVDAVVNANVLFYLGDTAATRRVIEHLRHVLASGSERHCDKWYDNPFVVWYFFSRALQPVAAEVAASLVTRLASATPSNALEHALRACTLLNLGRTPDVRMLIESQLATGAWPAAPVYHGGRRRRRDGTFDAPHPDTPYWGSEEWTTAFCIEALSRAQATGAVRPPDEVQDGETMHRQRR